MQLAAIRYRAFSSSFHALRCDAPPRSRVSDTKIERIANDSCRFSRRRGFTLVELLVVIAIIGILVALLLPAIQAARESARRAQCQNNLKQVLTAMHLFLDAKKEFPAGIEPGYVQNASFSGIDTAKNLMHSWVPYVLPYFEEQSIHDEYRFDKRWDDALTNAILTRAPSTAVDFAMLICPSTEKRARGRNDYGAIPGPGHSGSPNEGWCPTENWSLGILIAVPAQCGQGRPRPPKTPNPGAANSRIKIAQVTDGTTYTVCSENAPAAMFTRRAQSSRCFGQTAITLTPITGRP